MKIPAEKEKKKGDEKEHCEWRRLFEWMFCFWLMNEAYLRGRVRGKGTVGARVIFKCTWKFRFIYLGLQ